MATCVGRGADHCCWVGTVCPFLRDDGPSQARRWVCTLREQLGSWAAVHSDPRYLTTVRPVLNQTATVDCGDYPPPGRTCPACGVSGG